MDRLSMMAKIWFQEQRSSRQSRQRKNENIHTYEWIEYGKSVNWLIRHVVDT